MQPFFRFFTAVSIVLAGFVFAPVASALPPASAIKDMKLIRSGGEAKLIDENELHGLIKKVDLNIDLGYTRRGHGGTASRYGYDRYRYDRNRYGRHRYGRHGSGRYGVYAPGYDGRYRYAPRYSQRRHYRPYRSYRSHRYSRRLKRRRAHKRRLHRKLRRNLRHLLRNY